MLRRALRRKAPCAALLSLALVVTPPALAAPGDLVAGFADNGRYVPTDLQPGSFFTSGLAVDDAGRVLLGWSAGGNYGARRLTTAGAPDTTFGPGIDGPGQTHAAGFNATIGGIAVAPGTGRVIIAGEGDDGDNVKQGYVQDEGPTGMEDGGWTGGWKHFTVNGFVPSITAVAVQPDGKIVVVGEVTNNSVSYLAVERLKADGTPDVTFGDDGDGGILFDLTAAYSAGATAKAVQIAADGRIVIGGDAYTPTRTDMLVGRLTATGAADTTFSGDGFATFQVGTGDAFVNGVAVTPSGIVAGGQVQPGAGRYALAALRVTDAGGLDASFGSGGVGMVDPGAGSSTFLESGGLAIDGAGRVVIGGSVIGSPTWAAARLTAAGAPDTTFGTGGLAKFAMGDDTPSYVNDVAIVGDRAYLGGVASSGNVIRPVVAAVADTTGTAPAGNGGGDGGGAQQPAPTQTPSGGAPAPAAPSAPAAVTVKGIVFTTVVSTEQRVDIRNLTKGFHFTIAYEIQHAYIPYLDLTWSFTNAGCQGVNEGNVIEQTPSGGSAVVSADKPLKMSVKVCLATKELEKTCSSVQVRKTVKKGADNFEVFDSVLGALRKCKIDYDVKFTKKVDAPDLAKVRNAPAPATAKRKPIEAAIECSSNTAAQGFNMVLSEGVASGASYGFHKNAPQIGWTIPAGEPSFLRVQTFDKGLPMRPLAAKVFFDTDAVGSPKEAPRVLTRGGETIYRVFPAHTGDIRICAVYDGADGEASTTATIHVVAHPKVGDLWETARGRQILMTKNGPVLKAGFGGAKAASWIDDFVGAVKSLFGLKDPVVAKVESSGAAPQKKSEALSKAGYGLGQISGGGTLGANPGLPRLGDGELLALLSGQVATTDGTIIQAANGGTLIGTGGTGVVAPGGGNVVAPGGGNVIAPGGGNVIAPGGGNVIAPGGGNVIAPGGGNVIAPGGGNVIAPGGGNVVAPGGLN